MPKPAKKPNPPDTGRLARYGASVAAMLAVFILFGGILFLGLKSDDMSLTDWLPAWLRRDVQAQQRVEPDFSAFISTVQKPAQMTRPMANSGSGTTYYVSPQGSDNQNGRTPQTAWRKIQHALNQVRPGDTILVRSGIYREVLEIERGGTVNAPVTLARYPNEKPILDGTGLTSRVAVSLGSAKAFIFDGFIVRNYALDGFGFAVWGDGDDITVRNCEFYRVGTPVKIGANGGAEIRSRITLENIQAHDYPMAGFDLGPGPVEDVLIRNVRLDGVTEGNNTGSDAIAVERGKRIYIEDVTVTGHQGDGIDMKAESVTLRRATVEGHARNGIKIWKGNSLVDSCRVSGSRTGLTAMVLQGTGQFLVKDTVVINGGGENGEMYGHSIEFGPFEAQDQTAPTLITLYGNTFHTEGNKGVLIRLSDNVQILPDSDYNTYFTPRTETIFYGARNAAGAKMELVTPKELNNGAWARFIGSEKHSRFAANIPK